MDTLPQRKRQPIIDCVAHYYNLACACGTVIDVQLVPADGAPETDWTDPDFVGDRCPECILATVPNGSIRADLITRYNDARMLRRAHDPSSINMKRLGLEGQRLPTLSVVRWRPPRKRDPDDPYADEYLITGVLLPAVGQPYSTEDFTKFPGFRIGPHDDDPKITVARILLRMDIRLPEAPHVRLRFPWNPFRPYLPPDPMIEGWGRAPFNQVELLISEGGKLLRSRGTIGAGKPRGRFKRSRAWYLDTLKEHARTIRREPTEEEFITRNGVNRKTLKTNLEAYGLWPWEEFLRKGLSPRGRSIAV